MALGYYHHYRTADPGYSPVIHSLHRQDAGLASGATGPTLRASRRPLSAHRTHALLLQRLTKCIVEQHPTHRGNPRDTRRLAYKKRPADNLYRHGLLTHLADVCAASLVCEKVHAYSSGKPSI